MQSDYIVPEGAPSSPTSVAPRLAAGIAFFSLAIIAAGRFGDTDTVAERTDSKPSDSEIQLVYSQLEQANAPDQRTFLSQLTPISNASAKSAPVPSDSTLPDLPALDQPIEFSGSDDETLAETEPKESTEHATLTRKTISVRSGDSLSLLFNRNQLKTADWMALAKLDGEAKRLLSLRPGDKLEVALNAEQELLELTLKLDDLRTLNIQRNEDAGFTQSVSEQAVEIRTRTAQSTITNSLFLSAKDAGLSDRLTMELTDIFAWDVDFALDIRSGDSFRVIFEEIYSDGKKLKDGNILAAEFTNRGEKIQALRYTDSDGMTAYYSPEGLPMKKAFLRSPVDFARISSRFSSGRKHPVLNTIRAHKGVDYAAASGTPIRSAGRGKVVFAGRKGGYGNVVIVQHAGKYKTLYAHMKNFRKGIRRGVSVNQGQTIGYVGKSGLATGPHLHYEFLIHDKHVNPLTVKLPSAPRIAKSELARFEAETGTLLAQLQQDPALAALADASQ